MKKILIISIILICLLVSSVYAKSFTDVPETHWAYKYVDDLSDKGIINGYNDGTFKPSKKVTVAEFLKLIVSCSFSDEEIDKINEGKELKSWYDKYVNVIYLNGLSDMTWSQSDLNKPIYRIDVVKVLFNVCNYFEIKASDEVNESDDIVDIFGVDKVKSAIIELKLTTKKDLKDDEVSKTVKNLTEKKYESLLEYLYNNKYNDDNSQLFTDIDNLPQKHLIKLKMIKDLKLINGYEDGSFKPYNSLSRAEIATIITRYLGLEK